MTDTSNSLWAPLRFAPFRALWLGALAMNLAIWMQNVGAAWLMVSLTTSPLLVALVQTAISLPAFFFGLPGGVFADIFNRRRYLLLTQLGMLFTAAVLITCSALGLVSPWLLLGLTFCFGIGFALQGPAWYTTQAESVPRALMPSALALSSLSYSSARAVGPALAGSVVAVSGVISVFVICGVLLLGSLVVVMRMTAPERDNSLAPETLWAGLRGTIRYVRHSEVMRVQCLRTLTFVGAASGVWALLPVIASESGGAGSYGVLLGSLGVGTMLGAFLMPVLRARMSLNLMLGLAALLYAANCLIVGLVPNTSVRCVALFMAGIGWLAVGTTNLVAIQSSVPPWIRARAVAIYMLVFQGALAIGGALWGAVASHIGSRQALVIASVGVALSMLVMWRYPARLGDDAEVTPSDIGLPAVSFPELNFREGPVAVQIAYEIRQEAREEFLRQIGGVGIQRRRDGASFWRIYRELNHPDCYLERFIVDSWTDYLRHQRRTTLADQLAESKVRALHCGDNPPVVSHFIGECLVR
ncbi:MAG: putative major facilitator superfamily transporter [Pseudomonas sp.]|uniref:MFS transporter n=1 Tax=Pseudomonas sp. TaxID=306 RepID=UPI002638F901|nr:MFS transporter [Pseudomonas sp.]MDB6052118.1 putative major facilitator superfamily transporter [Pseudomonas sp.]